MINNIKMENRICKCGCNQMFKCAENSGQRYYSKMHIYSESMKNSTSLNAKYRRSSERTIPRSNVDGDMAIDSDVSLIG